ncbi:hypothetical protein U2F10_25505 [Leptothoe sp. EHU-05/26/07-4]
MCIVCRPARCQWNYHHHHRRSRLPVKATRQVKLTASVIQPLQYGNFNRSRIDDFLLPSNALERCL